MMIKIKPLEVNNTAATSSQQDRLTRWLGIACLALIAISLFMIFGYAPTAQRASGGNVQRIFYYHVSSAWVGFGAWALVAWFGWKHLHSRDLRHDRLALASAEVSVVFLSMTLLTGMLWGKPVWNAFWTWETKLTFSALQMLMYLAYLLLRSGLDDPAKRARFSAVYALLGAALIPFNFLVSRVLQDIHPAVFGPSINATQQGGFGIPPEMTVTLLVSLLTFSLVAWFFIRVRASQLKFEMQNAQRRAALLA